MGKKRHFPSPAEADRGVMALRIGFLPATGWLCAAALCLALALGAWLWARGQSGRFPPLLVAVFLIGAGGGFLATARRCLAASNLANMLQGAALACVVLAGASLIGMALNVFGPPSPGNALLRLGAWAAYGIAAALWLEHGAQAHFADTVRKWGAASLKLGASGYAVLGGISAYNPWWGMAPALAPGLPLLNALVLGYALPAALLVFTALRGSELCDGWLAHFQQKWHRGLVSENAQDQSCRAPNPLRSSLDFRDDALARFSLGAGLALGGLWAVLETRRAMTGPDLTRVAQAHVGGMLGLAGALALAILLGLLVVWAIRRRRHGMPEGAAGEGAHAFWQPAPSALALRPDLARPMRGPEREPRASSRAKRAIDPNLAPPV